MTQSAVILNTGKTRLLGILHEPAEPPRVALLLVVGGPQYRVGSHRQFVQLGRWAESSGHALLRFDYTGMGDSDVDADANVSNFERCGEDLQVAATCLRQRYPDTPLVMVGLCDAASAIAMFGAKLADGWALINPWVRSEQTLAQARVRHYYVKRLMDPQFWRSLLGGGVRIGASLGSLWQNVAQARGRGSTDASEPQGNFISRMLAGWSGFSGPVLVQLSQHDVTADEFRTLCANEPRWRAQLDAADVAQVPGADHTFSSRAHLHVALEQLGDWLANQYP